MEDIESFCDETQKHVNENFQSAFWLSNKNHVIKFLMANTYYRRNMHRFIKEYFQITLHLYQQIMIYIMSIFRFVVVIASRGAAKSFCIGAFLVTKAVLYPGSQLVITSGVKGQGRLIISEKYKRL